MNNCFKKAEILAPAGDAESFMAAVHSGADAIYIGLPGFNARQKASAFSGDELKKLVKKAHLFGVKVYAAANIVLNDEEFACLFERAKDAVEAKVDAFIVQDFGAGEFLKSCFEGITLHLSTQAGVHNLDGALVAKKLGYKRVVLSRETTLEDIIEIKKGCDIEVEYFIQGALCSAFSGNCYLSSFERGESGNRGRCAQLCRELYRFGEKEGYFLSAKDLSLFDSVKELMGVDSFKIEGRLRRAGYVATAVNAYRVLIDAITRNKPLNDKEGMLLKSELKKTFSRGEFNERAYLDGAKDIIDSRYNNHTGVNIGKVLKCEPFKDINAITVQIKHKLKAGDGLKFFRDDRERASLGVGSFAEIGEGKYKIFTAQKALSGDSVFLTLDSEMEKLRLNFRKRLQADVKVFAKHEQKLCASARAGDIEIEAVSDYICPKAKNSATLEGEIVAQLKKTGGFDIDFNRIDITLDEVFIPKSVLNALRRDLLTALEEKLIHNAEKGIRVEINENKAEKLLCDLNRNLAPIGNNALLVTDNILAVEKINIINKHTIMALFLDKATKDNICSFIDSCNKKGYIPAIKLPQILRGEDAKQLKETLNNLPIKPVILADNMGALNFLDMGYKVIASTGLNIMNSLSYEVIGKLGCDGAALSIEKSIEGLNENLKDCYIYSFGYPVLMHLAHCPYRAALGVNCGADCAKDSLVLNRKRGISLSARRVKTQSGCIFELTGDRAVNIINMHQGNIYADLRGLTDMEIKAFEKAINSSAVQKIAAKEDTGKAFTPIK